MKKAIYLFLIAMAIITGSANARQRNSDITFNYFYSTLAPYGEWIELDYDLYAWRPDRIGRGWQPYSVGRWVWSDYGWYWDSYEPYGWAVYHYGRWYNDEYYGWIWIPDDNWGPSWVEWRYSDDYIGWAPLPPYAEFRVGIGIHFTLDWHCYPRHWNYVRYGHFHNYNIHHHLLPDRVKVRVYDMTRYRNDYDYRDGRVINRGVDRGYIERRSGARVTERRIQEVSRLRDFEGARRNGNDRRNQDRIEVYRPSRQELNNARDINKTDIRRAGRPTSLELSRVENREIVREMRRNNGDSERRNTGGGERQRNNSDDGKFDRRNKEMNPEARPNEERPRQRTSAPEQMDPRQMPENRPRERRIEGEKGENQSGNDRSSFPRRQENDSRPQVREKRTEEQRGEERKYNEPRREERRTEEPRTEERRIERSRPSERPAAENHKEQEDNSRREDRGSRNEGGRRR